MALCEFCLLFPGELQFLLDHRTIIPEYFTEQCHRLNAVMNPNVIGKCKRPVQLGISIAMLTVTEEGCVMFPKQLTWW